MHLSHSFISKYKCTNITPQAAAAKAGKQAAEEEATLQASRLQLATDAATKLKVTYV